ncbi:class I SAM-dependent methyltransferase [Rhodococcus sp. NPDC047139]|uniref:SAM-dependent methyltransferase n=1 Tax=Rhodococcus sp. NPDC047139 TaxID=3155141 RepID=UPI0033C3425A
MTPRLSPRLAEIVAALPLQPQLRVLEIGCGSGAAARVVADRLATGHILAIDRSRKAIDQLTAASGELMASGRLRARCVAIEDFVPVEGEERFDLVFAIRVGALDGRHPAAGKVAMERIAAATHPDARLFVDGGDPLRELPIPRLS